MLDRFTGMQVFFALVRHGTFSAAAEELGISRAMASKHIQALENRLGVRLFNRTTRVTRLSEAGQRYFERVHDLFTALDQAEARVSDEAELVRGQLTIAAPPAFGAFHLAPVVADFMQVYPDISLRLDLSDRYVDLIEEGVDIAITVRELEDTNYVARHLADVRMVVVAAPAYLARRPPPSRPEDLVEHNALIFSDTTAAMHTDWQFQRKGRPFDVRVTGNFAANVGNALRNLALAAQGIARLPNYIVADDLHSGRLESLLERFAPPLRPVHALYAHRDYVPGKVRSFIDFASQAFTDRAAARGARQGG